jgi:predicted transcriptional regulator
MKLQDYLKTHGETQVSFSKRTTIPQTTIAAIVIGGGTRAVTAQRIIMATAGLVSLEDLIGDRNQEDEDSAIEGV